MIVYVCENCGAEVRGERPEVCPLCRKKNVEFSKHTEKDPDKEEKKSSNKYEEALEQLEEYTEGCGPEKSEYEFID